MTTTLIVVVTPPPEKQTLTLVMAPCLGAVQHVYLPGPKTLNLLRVQGPHAALGGSQLVKCRDSFSKSGCVQHKFDLQNPRTLTISEASLLNLNYWWHTRHASQLFWHSMTCIVKSVSLGCRCLQCGVSDISHLVTLNGSIPKICKLSPSPLRFPLAVGLKLWLPKDWFLYSHNAKPAHDGPQLRV